MPLPGSPPLDPDPLAALAWAAREDDPDAAIRALRDGAPIDALWGDQGITALAIAARAGATRAARALIDAGADPNLRPPRCATPLMWAAGARAPELARGLIQAGARLDEQDGEGMTALMVAAVCQSVECASALLEAGADLDRVNAQGHGALRVARMVEADGPIGGARVAALLESWTRVRDESREVAQACPDAVEDSGRRSSSL